MYSVGCQPAPPRRPPRIPRQINGGGKGGGGPGEGWDLPVDMWTSPHQAGGGGGVDGRERRRCARSGDRTAVDQCWRHGQRVPGVETERLRDDSGFSKGIRDHLLARSGLTGPLRAPVRAAPARCRPGWGCSRRERRGRAGRGARVGTDPRAVRRLETMQPSQRVGSRLPQSRPYPRGGSTLSRAPRSSAQIASSLSPSAVSWSASGRLSSHA